MNSEEIIRRAKEVMPGGVSSPVRALKGVEGDPLFVKKGKGAYIWDVDGKDYIDLCMSFGPLIHGHAHDKIVENLNNTVSHGTSFGISTEHEVVLAEKIVDKHPSIDWLRFVNSGTEAVMSVTRLSRGITGRNLLIKFKGCYHGHVDSMLVKSGSGLATFGISSSQGVPEDVSKNTIVLNLGDLEQVKQAFAKYPDRIAAVIIEGVPANNGLLIQTKEYMQELQKITKNHGAMFILDEVITGFRLGMEGATGYYDLDPDLVVMGKVIGGGLPVGLYGGKKQYMRYIAPLGEVYQAGTLSGNPLAMVAGLTTVEMLESHPVHQELDNLGNELEVKLKQLFDKYDHPLSVRRIGSIFWMVFAEDVAPITPDDVTDTMVERYKDFFHKALEAGVYLPPSAYEVAFLSRAHIGEVDELISRLENVLNENSKE